MCAITRMWRSGSVRNRSVARNLCHFLLQTLEGLFEVLTAVAVFYCFLRHGKVYIYDYPLGLGSIVEWALSPPRFLAECRERRLNQASFVLLYFASTVCCFWVVFSFCSVSVFNLSAILYFPPYTNVNGTV